MHKLIPLMLLIVCLVVASSSAAIPFVSTNGTDTDDAGFKIEIQRTKWSYDGLSIWGTVVSKDDSKLLSDMKLLMTAYNSDGKFLGRSNVSVQTFGDLAKVAYLDGASVNTGEQSPTKVVWQIAGKGDAMKGIEVEQSEQKTSADVKVRFAVQKIGSGYSGLSIWGAVKNDGEEEQENVTVIIAAYDANGKFLGRGRQSVYPSVINPGEIAYVDSLDLDVGSGRPARLVWKAIRSSY